VIDDNVAAIVANIAVTGDNIGDRWWYYCDVV
jgi:hypothetical protein